MLLCSARLKALTVILLATVISCGDGNTPSAIGDGGDDDDGGSTTNQIAVSDSKFTPGQTTVQAGTTITWTWNNTLDNHNVTFQTAPNSGNMKTGTFQRQFGVAGTFTYSCTNHFGMNGTIIVQ